MASTARPLAGFDGLAASLCVSWWGRGRHHIVKAGACQECAVVLSTALSPVVAKLATKIKSGEYVGIKELLADNMSLCSQLEALPAHQRLNQIQPQYLAYASKVLTLKVVQLNQHTLADLVVRHNPRKGLALPVGDRHPADVGVLLPGLCRGQSDLRHTDLGGWSTIGSSAARSTQPQHCME